MTVKAILRKRPDAKAISLILATFFNPLGFDAAFALVKEWTQSFWITDAIFYALSLSFFGLYFWLSRKRKGKPDAT